jgi:hypothetical protein
MPALPVNNQTVAAYTVVATDAPSTSGYQGIITMSNSAANTVTISPNATTPFPIGTAIQIVQLGTGQTSLVAGSGVTFDTPSSLNARAQYSTVIATQVAINTWIIGGDIA